MLELVNADVHLMVGLINLSHGQLVILFGLFVLEFQRPFLSFLLYCLVFLPILYTFLLPLLHKASISLQLVDLRSSRLLSDLVFGFQKLMIVCLGISRLSVLLFFKFLLVAFHV